jgi:alkylation response protein AidB-like acyl-CoA dehydrogenase
VTDFTELHDELRLVARDLLKNPAPDWSLLAGAGWAGLEVPEELDGAGATFAETAVILREMGRAATRAPYLGAAVLGVGTLLALQPGAQRDELLRQAAAGEALPVAAAGERAIAFGMEGGVLRGRAEFIPDAGEASHLLLPARGPGGDLVVVALDRAAPGLSVVPQPVVDETRRLAVVTAEGVEVPGASVLRLADGAGRLPDRAAVAIACDSLGVMEAMLDATVAYAKVRQQFGRPIGSFQAVQHACADMFVQVSVGRELVDAAVSAVASGAADAGVAASMAKAHVTAAAVDVAGKAMQLHGGIGYTWESGIHAYLKRATLNRALFGSPADHRRRLAARYSARYTGE